MKQKILVWILRLLGVLLMTAFFAVLLPYETMANFHRQLGLGDFPKLPILDYLTRSLSFFYGMHGAIIFFVSFDIPKYLNLIKFLCLLSIVFAVTLFFVDLFAPMPLYWTLAEGPPLVIVTLAIYWLAVRIEKETVH